MPYLIFKVKKTFVFDLDETLIHCHDDLTQPCDTILDMDFPNGEKIKVNSITSISL